MPMEKTFDAQEAESRIYAAWERADAFKAGANASRDESFCIMIPPPNVTGVLHMGHAFNNTLQDILIRWHRMRGFDTLWQPGQDHAGIATQMVVERQLAADQQPSRRELGREKFLEKVWDWKGKSGGTIIEQLKRLGSSCDWSRNAFTMAGAPNDPRTGHENSPDFHEAVIKVFVDMYEKGLIYRGKRLVNWDPHFETAISDLEVEQIEVNGNMWRLRYPLEGGESYEHVEKDEDGNEIFRETRDYLVVATTRPETMLGDTGVAVHPEDERYKGLLERGARVKLPLCGRSIPVVADEYADPTKGTGAVKITPAHDFNDWQVGQRAGLDVINILSTTATMFLKGNAEFESGCDPKMLAKTIERLDGQDRYEARDAIVTEAQDNGWLDGIDPDRHMVPHGDRSKVVIEPYLTDQWFVDTDKIVGPALDAVRDGTVKIMPESGEKTYYHWLENIEPWCISRQLWWGHQVPVWYAPALMDHEGEPEAVWRPFCAANQEEAFAKMADYYGHSDFKIVTERAEAEQMLKAAVGRTRTEGRIRSPQEPSALPVYRDPDVLDTWFSSGLWPIGTLGWPNWTEETQKYFPTNVLVTGQDILFFWVARMMMMQLAVVDQIPFDTVYLHGLVRDAKGKKMSKSTGNVVDPLEIIDEYGADALRFTNAAMASLGGVLKLDMQRIAGYRNFGTKIWNAARFAEMNGVFEPSVTPIDPASKPSATVNRWIIGETAKVREEVDKALNAYLFNDAANALYAFTWGKVCDWYVEFAKPMLQGDDEALKAETRATMRWVLEQAFTLLHPIMPFITEELWQVLGNEGMIVHADWPSYTAADLVDPEADAEMNWVITLIDGVRSARAQVRVPAGLKVPMVHTGLDANAQAAWDNNEALIRRIARIASLQGFDDMPKGCITVPVPGATFGLPVADIIDVGEEKARLEKSIAKLDKEIGGLSKRLNNPKFVASAPEDVVEEVRDNLTERTSEQDRLKEALERLAEIG
ncbi:valine--tRNA ligase [Aliiruegeria sabulilitoris]|uniref:valine--tRNA ligase n=1 Tax=Aliiruegeria sabulilitoris TaxID=1510458 RepID=UPI000829BFA4|nr:valine--tRNA ligase [Aliiruegeria sabulilitoris]NDR56355.1 valine--tRNA ligase [Pseudoruegeria sp. M32A2M]